MRSVADSTVCVATRAWAPTMALWAPFFSFTDPSIYRSYASDGRSASVYVERRVSDLALAANWDDDDERPLLDPALVVTSLGFQHLDRERLLLEESA